MAGRNGEAAGPGRDSSHLNPLDSEICGSSYPLSFPSQPPDIRNWFSSYEYESPESSIPHDLGEGESETQDPLESLGMQKGEDPPAAKDKDLPPSLRFVPIVKYSFLDGSSQYESCHGADFIQLKENQNVLLDIEGKLDGGDTDCHLPIANENSVKDHEKFLKNMTAKLKRKQNSQQEIEERCLVMYEEEEDAKDLITLRSNGIGNGNDIESKVEDDIEQIKLSFLNCNKEEPRENASTGGFISTKKRENLVGSLPPTATLTNHKNMAAMNGVIGRGTLEHLTREDSIMQENTGILAGKELSQAGKTIALADRTNVQIAPEIPGKWQCPRKSKPYIGPPLKQLRLERWVHRMN